jgi:hypothetical protein
MAGVVKLDEFEVSYDKLGKAYTVYVRFDSSIVNAEVKSELALQLERCCCDIKNGQQEIKCLIENTAKDQEIARLNRVVDAQRDQNIIQSVVAALKTTTAPAS